MSFLFKSKKNQDRSLSSRDGPPQSSQSAIQSAAARVARDEKSSLQRSTPTGSLNSIDNDGSMGSPDQGGYGARRPQAQPVQAGPDQPPSDLPFRNGGAVQPPAPVQMSSPNANLYPWTQRRLTYTSSHPSPFPRYGAAVNSTSSKEGDIYVMGGLINSATVKGDLWMIEAGGNLACYPLATTAEGPGPRVGHASLLVGNAFIVYGGDTKIDEADVLDETLYLLNTSTRQWSRSLPAGPRPSGRYGHSLNIIGSKIYIFGGQVEGYFMNDLSAFDLNQLQMPNNRWEMLLTNSDSGGPPVGKVPPARTNHTMITYNDKMYLFGGTNGFQWFNDVWCYESQTNSWTMLDCIGYIPIPREGHAAALVDDVMYIFGGRTEEGSDLGDLAAFRITSRRWYTFQNMGPSPSPRSGHSMTTVGKAVVVVGGEPSSAATAVNDLGLVYMLDTTKIRYPPNDSGSGSRNVSSRQRSASSANEAGMQGATRALPMREGSNGPEGRKMMAAREAAREGGVSSPANGMRNDMANVQGAPNQSKLPRAAGVSPPAGPPPSGPPPQGQPPRPTVNTSVPSARPSRGPSAERAAERGEMVVSPVTPVQNPAIAEVKAAEVTTNGRRTPTKAVPKPEPVADAPKAKTSRSTRGQGSVDSSTEPALKAAAAPRPASPPPPARQNSNPLSRRSSGRNSQTVALLKELDMARSRNAWYASELELARKAGYTPNATLSPVLEGRGAETFDDEDKPLIEALLAMRQELATVQASVDKQMGLAAKQIAQAEKQRDAAIQEAVYAKAKLAGRGGGSSSSTPQMDMARDAEDRSSDMSRKLAAALNTQRDLQSQVERLSSEIEAERRARQLADETTNAAQKRMSALESYKQQNSLENESLRAELHMLQREAREQSIAAAEATAQAEMLRVEKNEVEAKYQEVSGSSEEHSTAIASLRDALESSNETKQLLERKIQEEREEREAIQAQLMSLKAEHDASVTELASVTRKLQDAEQLAESHANEAKMHKQALMGGFDQIAARSVGKDSKADSERITALQGQLNAANALARKYQQQADMASDKLRSAEERIAGLEAYQEQASREGVTIRKQLQAALRDTQALQASSSDLKNQLAKQQLESNAVTVQHNTLKSILSERGISPTGVRSRGSPRGDSPEASARVRALEQQLESVQASHEENKQALLAQAQASENAYREKLSQLENDYQSAVHYVKGTEKMLKKLKEELARYKNENSRLKNEVMELEDKATGAPSDWESEKASLTKKIETLQSEMMTATTHLEKQMQAVRKELDTAKRERDSAVKHSEEASQRINTSKKDLEQLQHENAMLQERAQDAEEKVSLLLDQVETSVDNYRRRSRQVASMGSDQFRDSHSSADAAPAAANATAAPTTNGKSGAAVPAAATAGVGTAVAASSGLSGGMGRARSDSVETASEYGGNHLEERNSAALDSLANELETLRTHWEATNKNYRLSNTFDFEATTPTSITTPSKKGDKDDNGLSESLADWRKRLDNA